MVFASYIYIFKLNLENYIFLFLSVYLLHKLFNEIVIIHSLKNTESVFKQHYTYIAVSMYNVWITQNYLYLYITKENSFPSPTKIFLAWKG